MFPTMTVLTVIGDQQNWHRTALEAALFLCRFYSWNEVGSLTRLLGFIETNRALKNEGIGLEVFNYSVAPAVCQSEYLPAPVTYCQLWCNAPKAVNG